MTNFRTILAATATAAAALVFAAPVSATIYNTLGGIENGGDTLAAAGPLLGNFFVAGANETVGAITLRVSATGPSSGWFYVFFSQVAPYQLGDTTINQVPIDLALVSDSTLTVNFANMTVLLPAFALIAGDAYFVGIESYSSSAVALGNTLDPSVLARPAVSAGGYYFNNGGVQANAGGPYELSVNVPEPATLALLGLGAIALLARTRRARG